MVGKRHQALHKISEEDQLNGLTKKGKDRKEDFFNVRDYNLSRINNLAKNLKSSY